MNQLDPYWEIATLVFQEEVPGVTFSLFIGDGEDAVSNGYYFDIQRTLADRPDDQNVRNGTDSYCVVNESSGVHYGGIEEVSLSPNLLTLHFSDEAVEALGLPSKEIPLRISPEVDVKQLSAGLQYVLEYGDPQKIPILRLRY